MQGRYATSDQIAGHLSPYWAKQLGLKPGIPIPVGAFDAHWDAVGAGVHLGMPSTSSERPPASSASALKLAWSRAFAALFPDLLIQNTQALKLGFPQLDDIFDAIARRAGVSAPELATKIVHLRAGRNRLVAPDMG